MLKTPYGLELINPFSSSTGRVNMISSTARETRADTFPEGWSLTKPSLSCPRCPAPAGLLRVGLATQPATE